jgi:hypothetical protein
MEHFIGKMLTFNVSVDGVHSNDFQSVNMCNVAQGQ